MRGLKVSALGREDDGTDSTSGWHLSRRETQHLRKQKLSLAYGSFTHNLP